MPKYFRRDSHKLLTCSDQFKVSSNVIPRYLNEVTRLMSINSVVISTKLWGIGLLTVWKSMKFVLLAFIVSLLLIHHLFSSLNLLIISRVRVFTSGWCINRAVSSANNLRWFCPTALYIYISLMNIAKKQWAKNGSLRNPTCYIFKCRVYSIDHSILLSVRKVRSKEIIGVASNSISI